VARRVIDSTRGPDTKPSAVVSDEERAPVAPYLTLLRPASVGVAFVFAPVVLTLSAAANLQFGYPPERFPSHLRATGVGLAVASSRFGSALNTFLLPSGVQSYGVQTALIACVVVLVPGGIVCQA
jgi:putative MFS transporter